MFIFRIYANVSMLFYHRIEFFRRFEYKNAICNIRTLQYHISIFLKTSYTHIFI